MSAETEAFLAAQKLHNEARRILSLAQVREHTAHLALKEAREKLSREDTKLLFADPGPDPDKV